MDIKKFKGIEFESRKNFFKVREDGRLFSFLRVFVEFEYRLIEIGFVRVEVNLF